MSRYALEAKVIALSWWLRVAKSFIKDTYMVKYDRHKDRADFFRDKIDGEIITYVCGDDKIPSPVRIDHFRKVGRQFCDPDSILFVGIDGRVLDDFSYLIDEEMLQINNGLTPRQMKVDNFYNRSNYICNDLIGQFNPYDVYNFKFAPFPPLPPSPLEQSSVTVPPSNRVAPPERLNRPKTPLGSRSRARNETKSVRCMGHYLHALTRGETLPSVTTLARIVGCSKATASRAIGAWEAKRKARAKEDATQRYRRTE